MRKILLATLALALLLVACQVQNKQIGSESTNVAEQQFSTHKLGAAEATQLCEASSKNMINCDGQNNSIYADCERWNTWDEEERAYRLRSGWYAGGYEGCRKVKFEQCTVQAQSARNTCLKYLAIRERNSDFCDIPGFALNDEFSSFRTSSCKIDVLDLQQTDQRDIIAGLPISSIEYHQNESYAYNSVTYTPAEEVVYNYEWPFETQSGLDFTHYGQSFAKPYSCEMSYSCHGGFYTVKCCQNGDCTERFILGDFGAGNIANFQKLLDLYMQKWGQERVLIVKGPDNCRR